MLASWHDMLPQKMKEWELDRKEVRGCCRSTAVVAALGNPDKSDALIP
jgi:hypothetical protein